MINNIFEEEKIRLLNLCNDKSFQDEINYLLSLDDSMISDSDIIKNAEESSININFNNNIHFSSVRFMDGKNYIIINKPGESEKYTIEMQDNVMTMLYSKTKCQGNKNLYTNIFKHYEDGLLRKQSNTSFTYDKSQREITDKRTKKIFFGKENENSVFIKRNIWDNNRKQSEYYYGEVNPNGVRNITDFNELSLLNWHNTSEECYEEEAMKYKRSAR